MRESLFADDLKAGREDEYFRRREAELLAKLKKRGSAEAEVAEVQTALGLTSRRVASSLLDAGFTAATAPLVYLAPLIEVAWSDDSVSQAERASVLEAARERRIHDSTPAYALLLEWLGAPPPAAALSTSLEAIGALMSAMPEADRAPFGDALVSACEEVAAAAGGFLGIGSKVSGREREVLDRIRRALAYSGSPAEQE